MRSQYHSSKLDGDMKPLYAHVHAGFAQRCSWLTNPTEVLRHTFVQRVFDAKIVGRVLVKLHHTHNDTNSTTPITLLLLNISYDVTLTIPRKPCLTATDVRPVAITIADLFRGMLAGSENELFPNEEHHVCNFIRKVMKQLHALPDIPDPVLANRMVVLKSYNQWGLIQPHPKWFNPCNNLGEFLQSLVVIPPEQFRTNPHPFHFKKQSMPNSDKTTQLLLMALLSDTKQILSLVRWFVSHGADHASLHFKKRPPVELWFDSPRPVLEVLKERLQADPDVVTASTRSLFDRATITKAQTELLQTRYPPTTVTNVLQLANPFPFWALQNVSIWEWREQDFFHLEEMARWTWENQRHLKLKWVNQKGATHTKCYHIAKFHKRPWCNYPPDHTRERNRHNRDIQRSIVEEQIAFASSSMDASIPLDDIGDTFVATVVRRRLPHIYVPQLIAIEENDADEWVVADQESC
jgi:hypothetical protein